MPERKNLSQDTSLILRIVAELECPLCAVGRSGLIREANAAFAALVGTTLPAVGTFHSARLPGATREFSVHHLSVLRCCRWRRRASGHAEERHQLWEGYGRRPHPWHLHLRHRAVSKGRRHRGVLQQLQEDVGQGLMVGKCLRAW